MFRGDSNGNGKKRKSDIANFITLVGVGTGLVFGFRSYGDFQKLVEREREDRIESQGIIISRIGAIEQWRYEESILQARVSEEVRTCCWDGKRK